MTIHRPFLVGALFIAMIAHAFTHPTMKNNTRIVGGEELDSNYKHYVQVWRNEGVWRFHCGGSIYSERIILVAAHCVEVYGYPLEIRFGSHIMDEAPHRITVQNTYTHPKFRPFALPHDVAVLLLRDRITYDDNVQPVVVSKSLPEPGETVTMYGFGRTGSWEGNEPPSPLSTVLKKIEMITATDEECETFNRAVLEDYSTDLYPPGSFICFRSPDGVPCNGDSGGPAMKGDTEIQYGVGSYGRGGCIPFNDEYYTVYAALSYDEHYKFIRQFDHFQ